MGAVLGQLFASASDNKSNRGNPPRCLFASLLVSSTRGGLRPFLARSSARKAQRKPTTTPSTRPPIRPGDSELARSASQGAARPSGLPFPATCYYCWPRVRLRVGGENHREIKSRITPRICCAMARRRTQTTQRHPRLPWPAVFGKDVLRVVFTVVGGDHDGGELFKVLRR
jgi:hypothetical protein